MKWRIPLLIGAFTFGEMVWAGGNLPGTKPVPLDWVVRAQQAIEKALPIDGLVREFASNHRDRDVFPAEHEGWMAPYLQIVPVNLDGDSTPEQLLFISNASLDRTRLYVLKRLSDRWEVIYTHQAFAHNEPPQFEILDCGPGKKLISVLNVEGVGTGSWEFTRLFLRSAAGRVVSGAEIAEDHNLALMGYDLNGHVESSRIKAEGDDLHVRYSYEFEAGYSLWGKLKLPDDNIKTQGTLIKGTADVTYRWDAMLNKYRVTSSPLTEDQIRCFTRIQDESLFRKAFRKELQTLAKKGTPDQQKVARHFLGVK